MKKAKKEPRINLQRHARQISNPDLDDNKKEEMMQDINNALKQGDEKMFAQAFSDFADNLQQSIIGEAENVIQSVDTNVLVGRGVRQLTSKESNFYQIGRAHV